MAEEAMTPRVSGCPLEPSAPQSEEHGVYHMSYRNWCAHCVAGRLDNPAHRTIPREERAVPTVAMDYGFLGPKEECAPGDDVNAYIKFMAVKDRKSKCVEAVVVPAKGTEHAYAVDTMNKLLDHWALGRLRDAVIRSLRL